MTTSAASARYLPPSRLTRMGEIVLSHPLALTVIVLPLALILGSIAGYAFGRAGTYRTERLKTVSAELQQLSGDYLLAVGDSHIERWPARSLCGLPLVNAGVSGATAASYDAFLAELPLPRPPRAIIVTIGTNDANEKRFHDGEEAERRFDHGFRPLLARLLRAAPRVMLTGVPRIAPEDAESFSPEAAERIDAVARSACRASPGCRVTAAPGAGTAQVDGIHFKDYLAAYRGVGTALCTTLLRDAAMASGR